MHVAWLSGDALFAVGNIQVFVPTRSRPLREFFHSKEVGRTLGVLQGARAYRKEASGLKRKHQAEQHIRYFGLVSSGSRSYRPSSCSAIARSSRVLRLPMSRLAL